MDEGDVMTPVSDGRELWKAVALESMLPLAGGALCVLVWLPARLTPERTAHAPALAPGLAAAMEETKHATATNAALANQVENAVRNPGYLGPRLKEMVATVKARKPHS